LRVKAKKLRCRNKTPVRLGGLTKGTEATCGFHCIDPHAQGTRQESSGIPWAKKWPMARYRAIVAIQTLADVLRGYCAAGQMNLLPIAWYYSFAELIQPPSILETTRAKALVASWGFRLVIGSSNGLQPVDARPDAERSAPGCH